MGEGIFVFCKARCNEFYFILIDLGQQFGTSYAQVEHHTFNVIKGFDLSG